LNRKLKKAIQDSFSFPETERKEEFFAKAETVSGSGNERRRRMPVMYRVTAAAAACAAAFGLWCGLKYSGFGNKPDFRGDTVITEPSQTTEASTVTTASTEQSQQTASSTRTTADSVTTTAESGTNAVTTAPVTDTVITTNYRVTTTLITTLPPTITTDVVTVPSGLDDYERSYIMKKIVSYTAALAMMSTAIPTGSAAEYIPPKPTEAQSAIYSNIDAGKVNADFNGNGKVDIDDVYMLYSAVKGYDIVSAKTSEYFSKNGDINKDGKTDPSDASALISYYIYKNGAPIEIFSAENYKNDKGELTAGSYMFSYELLEEAEKYNIVYDYVAEGINSGKYDIDVNSDGKTDINDAFCYYTYSYTLSYMPVTSGLTLSGKASVLGSDIWAKCEALNNALQADSLCSYDKGTDQVTKYILYRDGVTSNDLSVNSYKDMLNGLPNYGYVLKKGDYTPNASDADFVGKTSGSFYTRTAEFFAGTAKSIALNAGMARIQDQRFKVNWEVDVEYFDAKFIELENAVLAGEVAPPDANLDGRIDDEDVGTLTTYFGDVTNLVSAEESELDTEIWYYLDTDFDIDGNGYSGDIYDIFLAQQFVFKYAYEHDGTGETRSDYATKLLKEYNKKHENDTETISKQEINYLAGLDVKRSGDANGDGTKNLADAVMIMQTVTNPDKYELSDWGEFNADVNGTGDGVTQMDACKIQRELLGIE